MLSAADLEVAIGSIKLERFVDQKAGHCTKREWPVNCDQSCQTIVLQGNGRA
jgi:hypothetical protein